MPKLNLRNKEAADFAIDVASYWIRECDIDGWRLDVAADLGHSPEFNHYFWEKFRKAVKEANPDAIVLAEHYGNPQKLVKRQGMGYRDEL